MNQASVDPTQIHLIGIKIVKELVECSNEFMDSPLDVHNFALGHNYVQDLNIDEKGIRTRLFLSLKALNDEEEEIGLEAEYGLEFHFVVENLNEFIEKEEDNLIRLKGALTPTLAGIAYSTARGVIWEKLSGTYFSHIVLPVINPNDLLKTKS